ncbi:MAG: hypothetical protein APR54_11355 [Candidatus Cloacimonas sp. SDB]|nr:MAG: hypothetical protein APR54_11355 [Candidatus Cloacimonas sp. SDB]
MLNNLKKAVSNSFIYSIGNLSTKIVGIILIPIYTQKLTTADYGMLGVLEITSELLIALFSLSIYQSFLRLYWDKDFRDRQEEMFFTSLFVVIIIAILMFLGFYPFISRLSLLLLDNQDYGFLIKLMLLTVGLKIIVRIPSTLLRTQEKSVLYTIANISRLLVTLFATIYFIIYLNHKVEAIFEAQIIGQIFYLLFLLPFITRNIRLKFNLNILKSMLEYGFPLIFSSISGVLLTLGDRYCLRFMTNFSDVGIYNLGYKVANIIKVFFISSVQLALPPMVFQMIDQPNCKRFYSKIMTYTALALSIIILAISILGKEAIKFVVSNKAYWEAYKVVPLLSFSMLFLMLMYTATTGLTIMKRTKILAKLVVMMSVLNIALNILFIPFLNIIGASLATLISRILHFSIVYYYAQKIYRIPYELKKIITMILTGLGLFLLSLFVNDFSLIPRLAVKFILILSFPLVLYFLNFYEPIELLRLKQSWQKWSNPRKWKKK